jgi:diketogulonate reductase-like aldo/keto reductase
MSLMTTVTLAGGVEMPRVGLGTWQLSGRKGYDAIRYALQAGYRHIDTATVYGNEAEVGRAMRDGGLPRGRLRHHEAPTRTRWARSRNLQASLRALDIAAVDLWLIHWPPKVKDVVSTWEELLAARADGLARAVGVSNFSTAQLDRIINETGEPPALNQVPWSPFQHSPKRLAEHRERGVVLEGYSPFKRSDMRSETLGSIAETHGVTPAQVVLRWHLQHDIVVIPKSATPERIVTNLDVYGFSLTDDEMSRIDRLS